ncbi:lysophospholipid acyltransferase family protein [Flavimaricola marinus]|uniref:Uncharacterized protein n=1 Tax=Flavimaricola marinus TaxID=1819565 RepID=A0A238L9V7_9RHOB|nr:DUF374 domain-containing protein [Flavimaricola marinus]SMY06448.1 hypothetical protein LOM8899_00573 [Flavimaricola marinus]
MSLARKIRNSPAVVNLGVTLASRLIAGWIRLCQATSRWEVVGLDEADAAMAKGPIVAIIWHECSLMAPAHWPRKHGTVTTLSDTSPIGRTSAAVQRRFGMGSTGVPEKGGAVAATRDVLGRLRSGVSVGLTGDGPVGPARVLKDAPLDWARAAGVPVFVYAFAMSRAKRLKTWDKMMFPMPFSRGAVVYRKFSDPLPRRMEADDLAVVRADLAKALTEAVEQAEAMVSRTSDRQAPR